MKKIFFIIALFAIVLSSNLYAKEPNVNVHKVNGRVVTTGGLLDHPYLGYDIVRSVRTTFLFWTKYELRCNDPGVQPCVLVVGGTGYQYTISDINNDDIKYDFNANLMEEVTNEILDEIDTQNINGENSGTVSRTNNMYDINGEPHYVYFNAVYQLDGNGDGEINVYINTIEM